LKCDLYLFIAKLIYCRNTLKCLALSIFLFSGYAFAGASEKIFVLHSYNQEYPWTRDQHIGFTEQLFSEAFDTNHETLLSTEYLDSKRVPYTEAYANFFADYLKKKYLHYKPKIVYVTDDNALSFAITHIEKVFPQAIVVFSGVNDYTVLEKLDKSRFTGVFEKKEISPNIDLLRTIEPGLNQILVVGDNSNTYASIKREINNQLDKFPEIEAIYIANQNIEMVVDRLKQQKQKYLFLTTIGAMSDNSGNSLSLKEIVNRISSIGDFTIVSMEDSYLLGGVLGGYVTSGINQGSSAAKLVSAHLNGRAIITLQAVTDSPNIYIFDHREIIRSQLSLPPEILDDAVVLNRPVSFYRKNRGLIIFSIIILIVLLLLSMTAFLRILSRKNRKIQLTSDKISRQSRALEETSRRLKNAQKIAHLGNWEWDINDDKCFWSEEIYRIIGEQPYELECSCKRMLSYVYESDREELEKAIDNVIKRCKPYDIEHRLRLKDGSIKYVRQTGSASIQDGGVVTKLVGTLLDVSSMKKYEFLELKRQDRVERYQAALMDWSRSTYKSLDEAFKKATEISAQTLDVGRVSVWLYNYNKTAIVCHDLFTLNGNHEILPNLEKEHFPHYFEAISIGNTLVINDARNDESTNEFTECYLIPNNIYSMLDVPILYEGEVAGVVCHESISEVRQWQIHEVEFASAISNIVSLSLEVDRRKKTELELEHQAYHDELTKLPNRNLFIDRLEQAIKQAHRSKGRLAVLFLDLDNFKEVNDSLGHAMGDQVLIEVAKKLQSNLRDVDTISRLGGDEYSLIISSFQKTEHIHEIAAGLFDKLQEPMLIDGHELYVTSSIGISIYPNDGETPDTLLRNADAAMYKAKEEGRNGFQFYTEDMTERAFERVLMESNLRRAIERDEFIVYYQPQYDASDESLIGMEALVRWEHPDMGLISPAKFIPVAEETGFIVQLDRWVFSHALKQLSRWREQGFNPGRMAFNLAMKQLHQDDLIDFILLTLKETRCKAEWLEFEVTEGQIMKKPEKAIAILQKMSDLGIGIAVDDFGTGYSSLAYLKRLPVNKLKIDQAFIHDLPDDEEDAAITCAVIALAKSLGLSVIAEGVEKEIQKEFLLQQGCNLIQGYLYSAPMPAEIIQKRF